MPAHPAGGLPADRGSAVAGQPVSGTCEKETYRIDGGFLSSLSRGETLPERNKDHALTGDWIGHRECHILPDWLLVYRVEDDVLVLTLARTGTHSDLFGK